MFFKQKNDKSRALVEFLKATQENPRLVKAYYEQALIFREKNYLKLAQSSLDQAIAIKPDYQEARMLLATVQIQQGNVGAAMKQLGQSLGLKVGTDDGADNNSPSVTVLQSLHSLMPENVSKTVMRVSRTNQAATKSTGGAQNNTKSDAKQPSNPPTSDGVTASAPSAQKSVPEGEIAFAGMHFSNPLHRFWAGMKDSSAQPAQSNGARADFVDSGEINLNVSEKKDKIVVRKSSSKAAKNAADAIFTRHTSSDVDKNEQSNPNNSTGTDLRETTDVTPVGPPPTSDSLEADAANLDINHLPNLPTAESAQKKGSSDKSGESNPEQSASINPASKNPASQSSDGTLEQARNSERRAKSSAERKRKSDRERNSTDSQATVQSTDSQVPEQTTKENSESATSLEKQNRKPKKSWFAHFIPSFDEDQDLTPPAPPPTSPVNRAVSTAITAGNSAMKHGLTPEVNSVVPTQVETFEKPDESRAFLEKVTNMAQGAANNLSNMAKSGFQIPNLPSPNLNLFNSLGTNGNTTTSEPQAAQTPDAPKVYKPVKAPNSDDPWSVRLRYLADHGTGTLKEGEAFMFSEETGEATLFLADGQTVHRSIYLPRDAQEVVKQRRPDILTPDELLYNLSLLAKLMPKSNDQQQQQNPQPQALGVPSNGGQPVGTTSIQQPSQSNFEAKDLMGKSQNFWGWLKGRFENLVPN